MLELLLNKRRKTHFCKRCGLRSEVKLQMKVSEKLEKRNVGILRDRRQK